MPDLTKPTEAYDNEIERLEAKVRKLLVENHELKRTRSEAEAAAELKGHRAGAEEVRRQLRGVVGAITFETVP